jgi:hypothetical protein
MKRSDLIKLLDIKRYSDKELVGTIVSFEAKCPLGKCSHSDSATVHDGDENGAKDILIFHNCNFDLRLL